MLFNSSEFLILLTITFIIYYLSFLKKFQVLVLVMASIIFYAYHYPILLLLFTFSILLNTISSYFIIHSINNVRRKFIASASVITNLSLLAFFKYSSMLVLTFYKGSSEDPLIKFLISIPLPIGISFYTFEGISLLIDVFKNKNILQTKSDSFLTHLLKTSFFISFFPHLIAGPILKAHDFYPQIKNKNFNDINWNHAIKFLILGYFFKMVVADNLKDETFLMTYPYFEGLSSLNLTLLLFAYSMQIFADFAGYSLIAIGLGILFGYQLPLNFYFPYISKSFSEFWTRWHISLSTWLKEYLYIPLGGNRKGNIRTYVNLMIVMTLGGLWHGAGWSYAIWGFAHGFALAIERFFIKNIILKNTLLLNALKIFLVFLIVTCLWLLFKFPEFYQVVAYFKSLWLNTNVPSKIGSKEIKILFFSFMVITYHLYYLFIHSSYSLSLKQRYILESYVYSFLLFQIVVNSGSAGAFIYFQF